ncbi:MAG: hypothetical protein MUP97_02785 [Acidimicrobiia bacterium]|nr:hypothetical protein [Acidimicrobiia bacterium]
MRPQSRTSRGEVRALLREAAERPVLEARPGFVSGLEAHLGSQVPPGHLVALPRHVRRKRAPVLVTAATAAAAAAVLLGALTGVYGRGVEDRALALAVAVDTTVQLPDGSLIEGTRGVSLPDGAVVRTGPNGHCSAGDIDFGPGMEALVDAGRLRLRPYPAGAAISDPTGGAGATPTAAGSGAVPVTAATAPTTAPTAASPSIRPLAGAATDGSTAEPGIGRGH